MALRKRPTDARLPRVVAVRAVAVDGVDFTNSGAEHAQGDPEIVSRSNLGDAAGKTFQPTIGKVVVVYAIDIGERIVEG